MNTERRIFCQLVNAGAFPLSGLGSALLAGVLFLASPRKSSQKEGDPWGGAGYAGSLRYSVSRATR
jgi:hypothetical protein